MLEAAQCVLDIPMHYLEDGKNIASAALAGATNFESGRHYPLNDVVDVKHHSRFFYHGHRENSGAVAEHGHFHLFIDLTSNYDVLKKQPQSQKKSEMAMPNFSHLAALSLDERGQSLEWFVTNRWVTGERWISAETLITYLEGFTIKANGRLAPIAEWLTAMVKLFQPQLTELLLLRDQAVQKNSSKGDMNQFFEDRNFEVLASCSASISNRLMDIR